MGTGSTYEWNFPLLYPLPAVLVAVPFALVPLRLADALFVGVGAGALAWALTRQRLDNPLLLAFASASYLFALQTSQWSPVLVAAALLPGLSPLLACKPNLAIALLAAYPRRASVMAAAAFAGLTWLAFPWWPQEWLSALEAAQHMTPLAARWGIGGPLLLLALPAWRSPEGRLLLAMACVPHTPLPYEALPLFLVTRRAVEAVGLSVLSVVVVIGVQFSAPFADHDAWVEANAIWVLWCLYLPSLGLVLARRDGRGRRRTAVH